MMQDLRSALQFVFLTIVARLGVYLIVRLIESVKPRSAHFIITSTLKPKDIVEAPREGPLQEEIKPAKGSRGRLRLRGQYLTKAVRWRMQVYVVQAVNRWRSRRSKAAGWLAPKFLTEIVGLATALVSLAIMLLNFFLK